MHWPENIWEDTQSWAVCNKHRRCQVGRNILLQHKEMFARLNMFVSEYCTFFRYVVGGLLRKVHNRANSWVEPGSCELPALFLGYAAAWGHRDRMTEGLQMLFFLIFGIY